MDKITSDVRHKQWLDIIHVSSMPVTPAVLQERPGVNRTVSRSKPFITGSVSFAAKRMMHI